MGKQCSSNGLWGMRASGYSSRSSLYRGLFENGGKSPEQGAECEFYQPIGNHFSVLPISQHALIIGKCEYGQTLRGVLVLDGGFERCRALCSAIIAKTGTTMQK